MTENKITRDVILHFSNNETITLPAELQLRERVVTYIDTSETASAPEYKDLSEMTALARWLSKLTKQPTLEFDNQVYMTAQIVKAKIKADAPEFAPRRGHNF